MTTPDFEAFWNAFPPGRRTDKPGAFEKWPIALHVIVQRELFNEDQAAAWLIRRAAEYAASDQGRGKYVRMPTTWLNQQGYYDPPEAWVDKEISNGRQKPAPTIRPNETKQERYARLEREWDERNGKVSS